MGLDITGYERLGELIQANHLPEPDHWRGTAFLRPYPGNVFPGRNDGIAAGWYRVSGKLAHTHFSYGGYNRFRSWIITALHGVGYNLYWASETKYAGTPMRDVLHFADNEGILGPQTCARIHAEVQLVRATIEAFFAAHADDYSRQELPEFFRCFEVAAGNGVVKFW